MIGYNYIIVIRCSVLVKYCLFDLISFDLTLFSKINTCSTDNDVTYNYYAKDSTRKQYLLVSVLENTLYHWLYFATQVCHNLCSTVLH